METPIKAQAVFVVLPTIIQEELYYFYMDPERIYHQLEQKKKLTAELERIARNLQAYLRMDRTLVNGTPVDMLVDDVCLEYDEGIITKPVLNFSIESEPFRLKRGENEIILDAEEEDAPYPCEAKWWFPGTVLEIETMMHVTVIKENVILLETDTNEPMGGIERFKFWYDPENSPSIQLK